MTIAAYLDTLLARGSLHLGQLVVTPEFVVTHADDAHADGLTLSSDPNEALDIARYDDAGKYRPLKSAANLKHGWRLQLRDASQVLLALDFLYPAALGTLAAWQRDELRPVSVRETLARQTGMYAVVKKITDEQIGEVKSSLCGGQPPCLRHILWSVGPSTSAADATRFEGSNTPILCAEICNLFVAEGRKVVKKTADPAPVAAAE